MSSLDSRTSKSEENSDNASRSMTNIPTGDQSMSSQDGDAEMNSIISVADTIQELDARNEALQKNSENLEETSERYLCRCLFARFRKMFSSDSRKSKSEENSDNASRSMTNIPTGDQSNIIRNAAEMSSQDGDAEMNSIISAADNQKAEITKLQQQNAKLKEDINTLKIDKTNLEKAHKKELVTKENLHQKAKEDTIKLHKADIEKLEKEHKESIENLNKIHEEDIEKLEKEHKESTENLNKMYKERIDAIEKESNEREQKFMEIKKELADRKKEKSMPPNFINTISGGTNFIGSSGSQVSDKTELETKFNYVTTALSQKEDENKELQENLRQSHNQLSKIQFELGKVTQKADESSNCNQRLLKRLEEEQNKSKELENEIHTLRNQNDNLKNEINALGNNDIQKVAQQEEANEVNATVIN